MPTEAPQHPQITQAMLELWLANPVTVAVLSCYGWKLADTRDAAGSGKLTDSSSADLTHALLHRAFGQQDAYEQAQKPEELLEFYGMIIREDDDDDG